MKWPQTGRVRWAVLLSALSGAAWLALFAGQSPSQAEEAAPAADLVGGAAAARTVRRAAAADSLPIAALVPRSALFPEGRSAAGADLFAATDWSPTAPLVPVPAPHPPPVLREAPPPEPEPSLPHRVIGKKIEAGHWEVFLERDGRIAIARNGAILEDAYRVDRVAPPVMSMTHIATGRGFEVAIGEAL